MAAKCYLDGTIVSVSDAKVGVYDMGLLRGFGIYEALTTFNRKPFRFVDHMQRFRRSAEALHISIPTDDEGIRSIIDELVSANVGVGKEGVIRIVLTGGPAHEGILYDGTKPTFYILVEELVPLPGSMYEKGASVTVFDFQRQFPWAKTTNYIQAALLQEERVKVGAVEILYTARNLVLECATSNFFIVKDGRVITPKTDILLGITRNVTLELSRNEFPTEEREISVEEMYAADEAFLTSSFKHIVPVVTVGGKKIGSGTVGPITKKLIAAFTDYAHSSQ